MVFLYILRNEKNKHYIGITSLELEQRLLKHNKGDVTSTKLGKPWQIIHSEKFANFTEAREREKQIKSWKGGNSFKKLLS